MGYQNVAIVFTRWTHLNDRPFRALAYMALMAKDNVPHPLYYGGPEALANALGRSLTEGADDEREAARRSVERVITALRRAGAIADHKHSAPGVRAEYELTLTGPNTRRSLTVVEGGSPDADRRVNNPEHPTFSVGCWSGTPDVQWGRHPSPSVGRILEHPTFSGANTRRSASAQQEEAQEQTLRTRRQEEVTLSLHLTYAPLATDEPDSWRWAS